MTTPSDTPDTLGSRPLGVGNTPDLEALCGELETIRVFFSKGRYYVDGYRATLDKVLSALRSQEEEIGGLKENGPERGDLWWGWDDPEHSSPDAGELADYFELPPGQVMRAQRADMLPDVWIARLIKTQDDEGDPDETQIEVFATEAEALAALTPEPSHD